MEEWKSYPIRVGVDMLSIDENVYHREMLLQQSSSLFCEDGRRVDLNYVNGIGEATTSKDGALSPSNGWVAQAEDPNHQKLLSPEQQQ